MRSDAVSRPMVGSDWNAIEGFWREFDSEKSGGGGDVGGPTPLQALGATRTPNPAKGDGRTAAKINPLSFQAGPSITLFALTNGKFCNIKHTPMDEKLSAQFVLINHGRSDGMDRQNDAPPTSRGSVGQR